MHRPTRALVLLAASVVAMGSCLGPTEVEVRVTTNACAALGSIAIYAGAADATFTDPRAVAQGCKGKNDVGTLAFVPSGSVSGSFELEVVGALGSNACTLPIAPGAPCIVARRSVSYLPHTRFELPVFLDAACAGIVCGEGETCVADPKPHCVGASCDVDGGVACADAGDGGVPPSCSPSAPDAGAPDLVWSFEDHFDQQIHEDFDGVPPQPQLDGFFATDIPWCGTYYNTASMAQPLVVADARLALSSFELAFAYLTSTDGLLMSYDTGTLSGGYQIGIVNGALDVSICGPSCTLAGHDSVTTADGAWHTFAMQVATPGGSNGSAVTLYRDGVPFVTTKTSYAATDGTLSIASSAMIDQVEFYAH